MEAFYTAVEPAVNHIADEIWQAAPECPGEPHGMQGQEDHFLQKRDHNASKAIAHSYANWATKLEEARVANAEMSEEASYKYRGRARGRSIRRVKAKAAPGRPCARDPWVDGRDIFATPLSRARSLLPGQKDQMQPQECVADLDAQAGLVKDLGKRKISAALPAT